MAKLQTKWIADDAINENKVKLSNEGYLRGRNFADSADINIIKIDASDDIILASVPKVGATDVALVSDIPSVFEIQGNWNATTNTPTLVSSTNSTGATYPTYIINVAGATVIDGQADWVIGDKIYFANGIWHKADNNDAVISVAGKSGIVTLDSDDITEAGNLFYTDTRAKTAAVDDTAYAVSWDAVTDVAPSKNAVYDKIVLLEASIGGAGATFESLAYTVLAGDITNVYYDLAEVAKTGSIHLSVKGSPVMALGTDYTISYTGGASSKTRISFIGDLASELAAGDILLINFTY